MISDTDKMAIISCIVTDDWEYACALCARAKAKHRDMISQLPELTPRERELVVFKAVPVIQDYRKRTGCTLSQAKWKIYAVREEMERAAEKDRTP